METVQFSIGERDFNLNPVTDAVYLFRPSSKKPESVFLKDIIIIVKFA
jgi:hypothetical protein